MKMLTFQHFFRRDDAPMPPPRAERQFFDAAPSMEDTRRDLAILASDMMGAQDYVGQFGMNGASISLSRAERRQLRDRIETSAHAYMVIDPRPGLHILDVNQSYACATLTSRRIAGDRLFDVFPDNPDTPDANSVANLYESIRRAAQSGQPHAMAPQRYDVRDADGSFVRRVWRPINTPIYDDNGRLLYILHFAEELSR